MQGKDLIVLKNRSGAPDTPAADHGYVYMDGDAAKMKLDDGTVVDLGLAAGPIYYARNWGAVPGAGDVTTEIQDALDNVPNDCTLYFEPGTYTISDTIKIDRVNVVAYGAVWDLGTSTPTVSLPVGVPRNYDGGSYQNIATREAGTLATKAAVWWDGETSSGQRPVHNWIRGLQILRTASGNTAGDRAHVGIAILAPVHSLACDMRVSNFENGYLFMGADSYSGGCAYNRFRNLYSVNCRYAFTLYTASLGWVNQNAFDDLRALVSSGIRGDTEWLADFGKQWEYLRILWQSSATYGAANNNVFTNCTFESEIGRKVRVEGSDNFFNDCRYETLRTHSPLYDITIGEESRAITYFCRNVFDQGSNLHNVIAYEQIEFLGTVTGRNYGNTFRSGGVSINCNRGGLVNVNPHVFRNVFLDDSWPVAEFSDVDGFGRVEVWAHYSAMNAAGTLTFHDATATTVRNALGMDAASPYRLRSLAGLGTGTTMLFPKQGTPPSAPGTDELLAYYEGTPAVLKQMISDGTVATLTPVELNVRDYGAVGNGSTNDSAAFQAAVDDLPAAGGRVIVPASSASYLLSDGIDITADNVEIVLEPGAYVEKDTTGTAEEPFMFFGTTPSSFDNLTADPDAGDVTIVVTTPASFSAGDWVMIKDDQERYYGGGYKDHWEINRVRSKSGSTLTLEWPLADGYATLSTVAPSVSTFTPILRSGIVGPGKISNGLSTDPTVGNAGVRFKYSVGCYARGLEFVYCQQEAVRVFDSCAAIVEGNYCHDPSTMYGSGRGVTVSRSTHSIVKGNTFIRSRHAVDISNFCRHVLVEGNVSRGAGESHYKVHPDVKHLTMIGNEADGAYGITSLASTGAEWGTTYAPGIAFDRGNTHITIAANMVSNCWNYGIGGLVKDTSDITIRANVVTNCNLSESTSGAAFYLVEHTGGDGVAWDGYLIERNVIRGAVGRGIFIGVSKAVVRDNAIIDTVHPGAGLTAGIFVAPYASSGTETAIADITVERNYIQGVDGKGIYVGRADATTSRTLVKGNTIRDCTETGIYTRPEWVDDLEIVGNFLYNCNTDASSTTEGSIVVGQLNATTVNSLGNVLIADNEVHGSTRAIHCTASGAAILRNKLFDVTLLGIFIPNGAAGQETLDIVIAENYLYNCTNSIYIGGGSGGDTTDPIITRNVIIGASTAAIRLRATCDGARIEGNVMLNCTSNLTEESSTNTQVLWNWDPDDGQIVFGAISSTFDDPLVAECAIRSTGRAASYEEIITTDTLDADNYDVLANTTGGGFTLTLPATDGTGIGAGKEYRIKMAGSNTLTIAAAGSNTIEGGATLTTLTAGDAITIRSDGGAGSAGNWEIVSAYGLG